MKRKAIRRLSLVSAFMVLTLAPQLMMPAIETEHIRIERDDEEVRA